MTSQILREARGRLDLPDAEDILEIVHSEPEIAPQVLRGVERLECSELVDDLIEALEEVMDIDEEVVDDSC